MHRSVGTVDLVFYGLVFMVPIAPWAIFGTVYNSASGMVPLVYLIGLVAMVFTALAYAQMAKSFRWRDRSSRTSAAESAPRWAFSQAGAFCSITY